jgi:hypothetical protein
MRKAQRAFVFQMLFLHLEELQWSSINPRPDTNVSGGCLLISKQFECVSDRRLLCPAISCCGTSGLDPNAPVVNGRYRATQSGFGLLTRGYIAFTSSHEHNVNNGHTRRTVSRAFRTTCV